MKAIHQRLVTLDQGGKDYELDYLTMSNGFVYRNAKVMQHDEECLIITTPQFREVFIATQDITTFNLVVH